jgi:uncharacterized protein (DUF952 family)
MIISCILFPKLAPGKRKKRLDSNFGGMIYHILEASAWNRVIHSSAGYYRPASLAKEGFIHCSSRELVERSANRYYPHVEEQELLVLHIVEQRVASILRWEVAESEDVPAGTLFPHLYGPLPVEAVETISALSRDESGLWRMD